MKQVGFFSFVLFLLGVALGVVLPNFIAVFRGLPSTPVPAANTNALPTYSYSDSVPADPGVQAQMADIALPVFNPADNFALLSTANVVLTAIAGQDYALLSTYAHPERGVTFTPYSTVDFKVDTMLSPAQVANGATDQMVYTWGFEDGSGNQIHLSIQDYFSRFVYNADYLYAPQVGVDHLLLGGNAYENVAEAYPGCRFVDFCYPGIDPTLGGLDWTALRLVFAPSDTQWFLVGVIHGQWTI